MKRRIRLTEGDLRRIVSESVMEVLDEGQGWNLFKDTHKRAWKGYMDDSLDDYIDSLYDDRVKAYIEHGDPEGPEEGYDYYDRHGDPCQKNFASFLRGGRPRPINRSLIGKIGRGAGLLGAYSTMKARQLYNKIFPPKKPEWS